MIRCTLASLLAVSCVTSSAETLRPEPACGSALVDVDGDGLSELQERELGTDPSEPDSDGDRLGDGVESALGTHPSLLDTDGDGFFDGDEVGMYRDPLDASSMPYDAGWPATPDLGAFASKGDGC